MKFIIFFVLFFTALQFSFSQQRNLIKKAQADTSWHRFSKMKDDTNKVMSFFYQSLESSVYDLNVSGGYAILCNNLAEKLNYYKGIIYSCDLLSNYYMQIGNYNESYIYINKSIRLKEKRNDHFGLAISYNQVAILFRMMKNYELAKTNSRKSISQSKLLKNDKFIALGYGTLANICYENSELDSAIYYNAEALELYKKIGEREGRALALSNQGVYYLDKKDYDKTISNNIEALKYIDSTNMRLMLISHTNLADAFLHKKNLTRAEAELNAAFEIMETFSEKDQEMTIYKLKSDLFVSQGDYKNAFLYNEKYQVIKDSIQNTDSKNKITELETKYQSEKKTKENQLLKQQQRINALQLQEKNRQTRSLVIILLVCFLLLIITVLFFFNRYRTAKKLELQNLQINKQNTTLKELNSLLIESEESLKQSNNSKEQLLSIISHDISSPIKAITTYNLAIVNNLDLISHNDLKNHFLEVHQSTNRLQQLTDQILEFSLTQKEGFKLRAERVEVYTLLNDLKLLFNTIAKQKGIQININVARETYINTDKNLILIILRNLIANAIKFSYTNSSIGVSFSSNTFIVEDFGTGMKESMVNTFNQLSSSGLSLTGTSNEQGTGLGWKLIIHCIQLLNYKIQVTSKKELGTKVEIRIE